MSETVPVRCPSCLHEHLFTASAYPCVCGEPVAPPLLPGVRPEQVFSRTWDEEWVLVRCAGCGRQDHWPQPELGCGCGAVLRVAVRPVEPPSVLHRAAGPGSAPLAPPSHIPLPRTARPPRPSFRPVAIRSALDAVAVAESYVRWLGFAGVERGTPAYGTVDEPPGRGVADTRGTGGGGIDGSGPDDRATGDRAADDGATGDGEPFVLTGPGVTARVDPSLRPVGVRAVECLWLSGLVSSTAMAFFSLGGYADEARSRADELRVPLFALDRAGAPRPVNGPAAELISTGA